MASKSLESGVAPGSTQSFSLPEWWGEIAPDLTVPKLDREIARLTDPASASETIHWGRNYLFRSQLSTTDGPIDVVVKQFRNLGWKKKAERKLKGSKAERSWRMAWHFERSGIPTAYPLLLVESREEDGPSFFITRYLGPTVESRYIFRAVNEGALEDRYPGFDYPKFLRSLGACLRGMHEAGLFHRDLSIGNVLLPEGKPEIEPEDLMVIDLNRARKRPSLNLFTRARDLCRLTIFRRADQLAFVNAYRNAPSAETRPSAALWWAYLACHYGFRWKIAAKKNIRAPFKSLAAVFAPRRAHAHIPDAPEGASSRDQIVWDYLSDQPHQHAGKLDKLKVRLADSPSHFKNMAVCARALPGVRRRYKELKESLYTQPIPWQGAGICVRPFPEAPDELLHAVDELGLEHVLLRLHPWQETHDDELELAKTLHAKGYQLAYSLPQNRDLVRNPDLWEERIEQLAELFTPYGRHFQVGQAVNRSKWGIWKYSEYLDLARRADRVLRKYPGVETFGPAVIDFELYSTASIVNLSTCPPFDGLASLLYVDRRGAPENRQMGFDTVDKVLLCQAIADRSKACGGRSWITEVNWPLWEGPHSPAGKTVSVNEEDQAAFLSRYFLLALTTGCAERVFWWQMIARGYGLIAPQDPSGETHGLRKRSSFYALKTLEAQLKGSVFKRRLKTPEETYLFEFQRGERRVLAGWSAGDPCDIQLDWPISEVISQHGLIGDHDQGSSIRLTKTVQFFRI